MNYSLSVMIIIVIGFTGVACQPCASGPCQNGGTCTNTTTTFSCRCQIGFDGVTCNQNSDWCGTGPIKCINGGNCTNLINASGASLDYFCNCDGTGFYGPNCQRAGSSPINPCANGAAWSYITPSCPPLWEAYNVSVLLSAGRGRCSGANAGDVHVFLHSANAVTKEFFVDIFYLRSRHFIHTTLSTVAITGGMALSGLGDIVMVAGGSISSPPTANVDLLNVTSMTWSTGQLSLARTLACVIGIGNTFYIAGGIVGVSTRVAVVDTYNILTGVWSTITPLPTIRSAATCVISNNILYVYGGSAASLTRYNITTSAYLADVASPPVLAVTAGVFSIQATGDKLLFAGTANANGQVYNVFNTTDQKFYPLEISPSFATTAGPAGQGYFSNYTLLYGTAGSTNRLTPVLSYGITSNSLSQIADPPQPIFFASWVASSQGVMSTVNSNLGSPSNVYTECFSTDNQTAVSQCTCRPGFQGPLCSTDINECSSQPCQNGATCHDGINRFTCTCVDGYTGVLCGHQTACVSLPCQNGGSCSEDGIGTFNCSCVGGYTGLLCQTTIDECASLPCSNAGTCVGGVNSYSCTCVSGYGGPTCQTNINECASNPCLNGGTCIDGLNSYTCTCGSGVAGAYCQLSPCGNSTLVITGQQVSFVLSLPGPGPVASTSFQVIPLPQAVGFTDTFGACYGLAWSLDASRPYSLCVINVAVNLVQLDPLTGVGTVIGLSDQSACLLQSGSLSAAVGGISLNPDTGLLYVLGAPGSAGSNACLAYVNLTTGVSTDVGAVDTIDFGGTIWFSSDTPSVLYRSEDESIFTVSLVDATSTGYSGIDFSSAPACVDPTNPAGSGGFPPFDLLAVSPLFNGLYFAIAQCRPQATSYYGILTLSSSFGSTFSFQQTTSSGFVTLQSGPGQGAIGPSPFPTGIAFQASPHLCFGNSSCGVVGSCVCPQTYSGSLCQTQCPLDHSGALFLPFSYHRARIVLSSHLLVAGNHTCARFPL